MNDNKSRIVYKVVRIKKSGMMTSCYAPKGWKKIYKIGRTSSDRRSKLIAFFTLKDALKFWGERVTNENIGILKCTATGVTKPKFYNHPAGNSYPETAVVYQKFWKNVKKGIPSYCDYTFPKGTAWCDSITPTEVIK